MKIFVFCLLLVETLSNVRAEKFPTFEWHHETSRDGVQLLNVQFSDDATDVAVLTPFNPIPVEVDESRSNPDNCIFRGHLEKEPKAIVIITGGCTGEKTFDIQITSSRLNHFLYHVKEGVAIQAESKLGSKIVNRDGSTSIFMDKVISTNKFGAIQKSSRDVSPPTSGFIFKLAIIYDQLWLAKYVTHDESVNAVRRLVAQTQGIYGWPTLTVPIVLKVVSVVFKDLVLSVDGTGLRNLMPFLTDASIDNYVALTNKGSFFGLSLGFICESINGRAVIVQAGSWGDFSTSVTLAHELGHSLGMPHDFSGEFTNPKSIRLDSHGQTCTDINGVMDYYVKATRWSTCSNEFFYNYYNDVIKRKGSFCLEVYQGPPVDGSWSEWTTISECSQPCGSGTYSRSRICNNPYPYAGGQPCQGEPTDIQLCNTQACPLGAVVVLKGGKTSNEGDVYARNPTTGIYGPVCSNNWSAENGDVACKSIGYLRAYKTYMRSPLPSNTTFSYNILMCKGTEQNLNNCRQITNGGDCKSKTAVGVLCTNDPLVPATVVLVGGSTPSQGNVYATNPVTNIFGPVCSEGFDMTDATVICKQLGFSKVVDQNCCSRFGLISTKSAYSNLQCTGTEASMDACPHTNTNNCDSNKGANIVCA